MAERIPNAVAKTVVFRAYLSSDHVTTATSKTIAITISKNGGAFGNPNVGALNATEISSGFYKFTLDTTDTNTNGPLAYRGAVATVDDVGDVFEVTNATNAGFTGVPNAVAGASNGLLINGSNSGTVTLAALTCTGSFTISDGMLVSRSTTNGSAITATGNGTGSGIVATSGSGATGDGIQATAASTAGNGLAALGTTTGHGLKSTGGTTGHGALFTGGGTSGDGVRMAATTSGIGLNAIGIGTTQPGIKGTGGATTSAGMSLVGGATSGDGLLIAATSGHGINSAGAGTTKHGINATGGATSSDGIRATGGGTGNGLNAQSGSGATGDAILAVSNATAGNGLTLTHAGTGKDLNATTTPLILAKTTNITGFNDLSAASIATGVWQDTTAGDFTAPSSIGKSVMNGVALGTGLTINAYTGDTPQTGDVYPLANGVNGFVATKADTAAIKLKTDNLPSDPADASDIAGRFTTLDAAIDALPTNTELATALGTADDAILAILGTPAGASMSADIAAAKTDTAAIKLKTDKLTYTTGNNVDVNIQYINGVAIVGDGSATPFNV